MLKWINWPYLTIVANKASSQLANPKIKELKQSYYNSEKETPLTSIPTSNPHTKKPKEVEKKIYFSFNSILYSYTYHEVSNMKNICGKNQCTS